MPEGLVETRALVGDGRSRGRELGGRTVLVAVDDLLSRGLLVGFCRLHGASRVIEVDEGQAAMDRLADRDNRVDFVLLDADLPDIDGLTVLERITSGAIRPDAAKIPVIVLASSSDPGQVATALAHNAESFLVKPVARQDLLDAISAVISSGRSPFLRRPTVQ